MEICWSRREFESQDWAEMLRRMYLKWFDKKKYTYQVISEHMGEESNRESSTAQKYKGIICMD